MLVFGGVLKECTWRGVKRMLFCSSQTLSSLHSLESENAGNISSYLERAFVPSCMSWHMRHSTARKKCSLALCRRSWLSMHEVPTYGKKQCMELVMLVWTQAIFFLIRAPERLFTDWLEWLVTIPVSIKSWLDWFFFDWSLNWFSLLLLIILVNPIKSIQVMAWEIHFLLDCIVEYWLHCKQIWSWTHLFIDQYHNRPLHIPIS